jgi:hypothetical protein
VCTLTVKLRREINIHSGNENKKEITEIKLEIYGAVCSRENVISARASAFIVMAVDNNDKFYYS